jgi:hypothetical protein
VCPLARGKVILTVLILVQLVHGEEPHQLKIRANQPSACADPEVPLLQPVIRLRDLTKRHSGAVAPEWMGGLFRCEFAGEGVLV